MEDRRNFSRVYALYTRHRFEKKVDPTLRKKLWKAIFLFIPSFGGGATDGKSEEHFFSGYVFVRIPLGKRISAVQTDGVYGFIQ
jgi:transcription antitermination factor NusG